MVSKKERNYIRKRAGKVFQISDKKEVTCPLGLTCGLMRKRADLMVKDSKEVNKYLKNKDKI